MLMLVVLHRLGRAALLAAPISTARPGRAPSPAGCARRWPRCCCWCRRATCRSWSLAWIATSLCLHQLLLFYRDRVPAQRAARKKAVIARLGDAALIGAVLLLAGSLRHRRHRDDPGRRAGRARAPPACSGAAGLLALAALLKSAQFPTHGWLTEVMETPTPVSALLHAGVINAGGFLLIRFADVMLLAPGVLAVLVMIGGFTALFGGLVMLTQPAVKTSLAWSTIAPDGLHDPAVRAGAVPAGAAAHRRALALQGACLPRLGRGGGAGRGDPAARPGRHPGGRRRRHAPSCWRLPSMRSIGLAFGFDREVAAGDRAGRHPDLRRGLPAGAGPGRRRARAR